jgi:hypothetical protein
MRHAAPLFAGLVLALSLLPATAPARGQVAPLPDSLWSGDFARIEALLAEEDFEKAEKKTRKLVERMISQLGFYESNPRIPARALLYLALAESGLGRDDAARWHLDMARNLDRQLVRDDLERYGPAAAELARSPYRPLGTLPTEVLAAEKVETGTVYQPLVLQSRETRRLRVPCRGFYDQANVPPPLQVEVLVDAEGRPTQPRLIGRPRFPMFALVGMEQLQDWRYRPATKGGRPVSTLDRQRIDFPFDSSF